MYFEEEPRKKKRRKKRRGLLGTLFSWIIKLAFRVILLALVLCVILYALPVSLFITDPTGTLSASDELDTDVINVLLLGVDRSDNPDSASGGTQRSDTIMIMSIGYNSLSLTSILRDTQVRIPGYGSHKINAAYAYGGPELIMRTLNENFGLNITRYIVVDFFAVADIINALGGIDVQITQAEQNEINRIMRDNWRKDFSKRGYDVSQTSLLDCDFSKADADGKVTVHVDGFQGLAYARIRKVGNSDFERTMRQRKVIGLCLSEFKSGWYNPFMLYSLAEAALEHTETNMSIIELISIGSKALFAGDIPQLRLPANGTYSDSGSTLADVDYSKNHQLFVDFAYGE